MEILDNRKSISKMLYALNQGGISVFELSGYCDDSDKTATFFEVVRDLYDDIFGEEILEAQKMDSDYWDRADNLYEMKRDRELEESHETS